MPEQITEYEVAEIAEYLRTHRIAIGGRDEDERTMTSTPYEFA